MRTLFQIIAVFLGFGVAGLTGGFVGGLIAGGIANFRYLDLKISPFQDITSKKPVRFFFLDFLNREWFIGILLC